jgi:hypothetical protein
MSRGRAWRAPLSLYGLALIAGSIAASRISFPPTEVSAYVLGVARNLVAGRGLVSDAVWNYASGPFVLPRPAFDIWQPLPGFLAALPMTLAGPSFTAAQAGSVLLGAAIAPLTWWIARDAASRNGLAGARAIWVALGAGGVAAVFGPFLTAMAGPDSFVPFTVFALAACALMPTAIDGGRGAGIALGLALGLAYLSRQEAIFFGLAYLAMAAARREGLAAALRWPVVVGAVVVLPWIVRNALTFQGGLRQTLENAWLTDNDQIFAFLDRPSAATFLAQGPATILGHVAAALVHDLVDVLLVPGAPIGIVGLIAVVALRRTPALVEASPLRPLLVAGVTTFLVASIAFPVATLWGTYAHAAGPALVGLIVASGLGLDAALARLRSWRGWARENAWLAPLATLASSIPVAVLSVALLAAGTAAEARRMDALREALPTLDGPVITDHPMWVSIALGVPTLARPHEPDLARQSLAAAFDVHWLLLLDDRDGILADTPTGPCARELPVDAPDARLFNFRNADECQPEVVLP